MLLNHLFWRTIAYRFRLGSFLYLCPLMPTSLRILHVTPYYAPASAYGGVVSAVTGLATAQAERGHRVTVLTTDALTFDARNTNLYETLSGVEVIRCRNLSNTIRANYNLSLPLGFRSAFRPLVHETDVVHTHELRTVENLLIDHSKPVILSPHGTLPYQTGRGSFKQGWDRLFGRRLLQRIDAIAALTAQEADEAHTLWHYLDLPLPAVEIIPNGVAPDFAAVDFSAQPNLRARYSLGDGPVVLFLGRLHERKGLQFLIPAFARVVQASPGLSGARLLIVGPDEGMLAPLRKLAQQENGADQVIFTGLLEGTDRLAAFATANVFALPAIGEGLSMAALEAMAARLPVILTPSCNLPDVETRGAGLLIPREIEPLANALKALLADPIRRKVMGIAGHAWVQESFTWPTIAARTEHLYEKVKQSWK
jgi:glycosyltransferase involved in cell wall biosynthesis